MRFLKLMSLVAIVAISGCGESRLIGGPVDQADLCEVKEWAHDSVASSCTPGQKVVFLPGRWGNEQLPVIFAAVNCDLRYSVVHTNGAVTCIYAPITPRPGAQAEEPEAPADSDES